MYSLPSSIGRLCADCLCRVFFEACGACGRGRNGMGAMSTNDPLSGADGEFLKHIEPATDIPQSFNPSEVDLDKQTNFKHANVPTDTPAGEPGMDPGSTVSGGQPHMNPGSAVEGGQPHMDPGSMVEGGQPHMDGGAAQAIDF